MKTNMHMHIDTDSYQTKFQLSFSIYVNFYCDNVFTDVA